MNLQVFDKLKLIAKERQTKDDPSHDFEHIKRVLNLAIKIGESVGADLEVVIPAALFHDTVVYRKDSPQSKNETDESADVATQVLEGISDYPKQKIKDVVTCIKQCSFSKAIIPELLESKVLQDADLLESTGAISIIRTFSSGGQMNRGFYNPDSPLDEATELNSASGVALFYKRLLIAEKRMHTKFAKKIAKRRTKFLHTFLKELKLELTEADIINS